MTIKYRPASVFIFITIVLTITAGAQRDYRKGYLIGKDDDTIRGSILYRDRQMSEVCIFKTGPEERPVNYYPKDIRVFRFSDGKYFISGECLSDQIVHGFFLEILIKGKTSLYWLCDDNDRYFIETGKGMLTELTEPEQIIRDKNGSDFVKPSQYRGKLKAIMSDSPEIFPQIGRTELNHSSLIRLVRNYNEMNCSNEPCVLFEQSKKPLRVRIGIYGALQLNSVKFGGRLTRVTNAGGGVIEYGDQLVSDWNAGGLAGLRIEFENLMATIEHASLIADIVVQGFSHYYLTETGDFDFIRYNGEEFKLSKKESYGYQTSIEVNLKAIALKIPLLFNYTFLAGKIRPYLNAGIMNMLILRQNKEFELYRFTEEYGKSVPFYHLGGTGSAGIRIFMNQNYFLFAEAGYTVTFSPNTWRKYRLITNQFDLKLGVSF